MPPVKANGIELFYEEFGATDAPAVLLVNGFTSQCIAWDEPFCEMLAGHGFRVIRFDNRDVGLSHKTEGDLPNFVPATTPGALLGLGGPAPYTLVDMASDAVGILDVLGIEKAHVVGMSMGGMIVQRIAIDHPNRVLSLTSIMSTTGDPAVGGSTPEAARALLTPAPAEREAFIDHSAVTTRVFHGPLWDESRIRARAARAFDRSFSPRGAAFQLAAILSDGNRTEQLAQLDIPTLVIHGVADTLVKPSAGEATAAAIPGAELLMLEQMGHDLPPALWPQITGAIAAVAGKVVEPA